MNYKPLSELPLPELLSLTLRESPETTAQILNKFPTLKDLSTATSEELQAVQGVGPVKARQIISALELGKRLYLAPPEERFIIKTPEDVANLVMAEMRYLDRERFRVIHLNMKHHVLGIEDVSVGLLGSSLIHPRECFKNAIKRSSAAIVLVHNHPSGDPEPSTEDSQITSRLIDAGKILGIGVLDHIVIGDGRFVSLKERGLM